MRRREFLHFSCIGGVALGVAPAWAAPALAFPPELRVECAVDGRWMDAALAPPDKAAFGSGEVRVTVRGMEDPELERLRTASIEIAYPAARVLAWAHRGGAVPSTGRVCSHRVPLDRATGLELFVSAGRESHHIALQTDAGPGPKLRPGAYRISSGAARWFIEFEEV